MNDEYLWQKTGEDPETMDLENALAVFRYREDDPPAVPIAAAQKKTRGWRFALAFAVPTFAAVAVAAIMWLPIGDVSDDEVTFIYQPSEPTVTDTGSQEALPVPQPTAPTLKQPVRRGDVQPTIASVHPRPRVKPQHRKTTTVALTDEERYAYRQLMLALSISSSKLNIVRNTINGVEESDNDTKQNNR